MLKDNIKESLKQSMLARDAIKTSTLRMLLSALGYYEIQKGGAGYSATDEDVLTVVQKEVKQRHDSIEQFDKGGRSDLVEKETKELRILEKYLPVQMSEDDVQKLVKEAIENTNAKDLQDIGRVMAVLMPKTKGKADGSLVSKLVKQELQTKA